MTDPNPMDLANAAALAENLLAHADRSMALIEETAAVAVAANARADRAEDDAATAYIHRDGAVERARLCLAAKDVALAELKTARDFSRVAVAGYQAAVAKYQDQTERAIAFAETAMANMTHATEVANRYRSRCDVEASDVEAAGVTLPLHTRPWLNREGKSEPDWLTVDARSIAEYINAVAASVDRPAFDILDAMAAITHPPAEAP